MFVHVCWVTGWLAGLKGTGCIYVDRTGCRVCLDRCQVVQGVSSFFVFWDKLHIDTNKQTKSGKPLPGEILIGLEL
jgi:hypothetical protein